MLILPKRKSTFNFYESFSDLVFCALVMFLVLVLFLAMNVNQKQEQVEGELLAANQTLEQADADAAKAADAARLAELEAEQIRAAAEAEAQLARDELERNRALREEALALRDAELASLEAQRQEILAEVQRQMLAERERLEAQRREVVALQASLEAERQAIQAEQQAVSTGQARIAAERERLDAERAGIATRRASIENDRKAIAEEQTRIATQQQQAAADRERLVAQQAEVTARRAALERDRQAMAAEQQRIADELARMQADRTRVLAEQKRIEAEQLRVAVERERIATELAKIDAQRERVEAELLARREALEQMQAGVERQRRVYERVLGVNRFANLPTAPRLVVAYDWQPNRIAVHPVPARLVEAINTTPAGLEGQALAGYYAEQRAAFLASVRGAEPLNPRQYRALVRSVSVGLEPIASDQGDGQLSLDLELGRTEQGLATTRVDLLIPGGRAERAGVAVGDELIALGDQGVTPNNLAALVSGYRVGDSARLLVRREGRPMALEVVFDALRVVELAEAYRTDLSLVASGALDTDYTYLWAAADADALRAQLQAGKANAALWQNQSRWTGRSSTTGRPTLSFDAVDGGRAVLIGGERFSLDQFRRVLAALGDGIVVEYTGKAGPDEMPKAIVRSALEPTGFVVRAPQLEELLQEVE